MLRVLPNLDMAQTMSLRPNSAPMVRDTPVLRQVFSNPKSRDGSSKKVHKTFVGGAISLVGSKASAGLSGHPHHVDGRGGQICDSAGGEGNPASIAEKRVSRFWNSEVILTASPTNEGVSEISKAYRRTFSDLLLKFTAPSRPAFR